MMREHRTLLDNAAKAAGHTLIWVNPDTDDDGVPIYGSETYCYIPSAKAPYNRRKDDALRGEVWSPLEDDGDAFRLAVHLRISIYAYDNAPPEMEFPRECAIALTPGGQWLAEAPVNGDYLYAVRLAIVRAASAIGESIK